MEIEGDMGISGGMTDADDPLLRRFILISKTIKTIKTVMIAIAISESKMIPHGCSYQARPLPLFVGCPFSPGVEENDGG